MWTVSNRHRRGDRISTGCWKALQNSLMCSDLHRKRCIQASMAVLSCRLGQSALSGPTQHVGHMEYGIHCTLPLPAGRPKAALTIVYVPMCAGRQQKSSSGDHKTFDTWSRLTRAALRLTHIPPCAGWWQRLLSGARQHSHMVQGVQHCTASQLRLL